MSALLKMLREPIEMLAAPADRQDKYIADQQVCIDELALDLDAVAPCRDGMLQRGELNAAQHQAVGRVDADLHSISGKQNAYLWTPEALYNSPEWRHVRELANECLDLLGKPNNTSDRSTDS